MSLLLKSSSVFSIFLYLCCHIKASACFRWTTRINFMHWWLCCEYLPLAFTPNVLCSSHPGTFPPPQWGGTAGSGVWYYPYLSKFSLFYSFLLRVVHCWTNGVLSSILVKPEWHLVTALWMSVLKQPIGNLPLISPYGEMAGKQICICSQAGTQTVEVCGWGGIFWQVFFWWN